MQANVASQDLSRRIAPTSGIDETTTMTCDFDTYRLELTALLQKLMEEEDDSNQTIDQGSCSSSSLQQQCSDLLRLMTMEARSAESPDDKFERLERVKLFQFQFETIVAQQKHQADKCFLFNSQEKTSTTNLDVKEESQQTQARAMQQNEMLERARRSLAETEQVGSDIGLELGKNRQTIQSAKERVDTFASLTEQADSIITNMSKPWWRRKWG